MIFLMVPHEIENIKNHNISDDDILRIGAGNKEALRFVYDETRHIIYGFALSITKNTADAEDILQDTYIKLISASKTYVPKGKPMALIFTIARNLSLMKLREGKKTQLECEDLDSYIGLDLSVINNTDEKMMLCELLTNLTTEEQQIILMYIVAGFKHREIAKILNLPISTILSKYSRALKKLRSLL